jgi:hypothetical protein
VPTRPDPTLAVQHAISHVLGFDPDEYDGGAQLESGLDADSLSRAELAAHLSDRLGGDYPPPSPDCTVDQLIDTASRPPAAGTPPTRP